MLYDYCLTFIAEVERCWAVRRLSWSLGFFYLNRYLALFGYIPVMLALFWSTSNTNKAEVSILLLKSLGSQARWSVLMHAPMLPDVGIHPSLALENGQYSNDIFCQLTQLSPPQTHVL